MIYASIIFKLDSDSSAVALFARRSPDFHRKCVKKLWIMYPVADIMRLASLCSGVAEICLRLPPLSDVLPENAHPLDSPLGDLRPQRFVTSFSLNFGGFAPEWARPFYSNLTHLVITDDWDDWKMWPDLCKIPRLSHLMIGLSLQRPGARPFAVTSIAKILHDCKNLQVFVIDDIADQFGQPLWGRSVRAAKALANIEDPRLVVFRGWWDEPWSDQRPAEWEDYWNTVTNLWSSAEAQVKRRRVLLSLHFKDLFFEYQVSSRSCLLCVPI